MQRVGIVLKQLDSPHKIALLDRDSGRVDGIVFKSICVGSLLHYMVDRERGSYLFLSHCSITNLPFALARTDILFWHHVLELCFYFLPVGHQAGSVFELLHFLYTVEVAMHWEQHTKKLYLFKLLAAIGLYDALPQLVPAARVHELLAVPLADIMHYTLDEKSERVMNKWLRTCIAEHPKVEQFNTVHFLVQMDDHE